MDIYTLARNSVKRVRDLELSLGEMYEGTQFESDYDAIEQEYQNALILIDQLERESQLSEFDSVSWEV